MRDKQPSPRLDPAERREKEFYLGCMLRVALVVVGGASLAAEDLPLVSPILSVLMLVIFLSYFVKGYIIDRLYR